MLYSIVVKAVFLVFCMSLSFFLFLCKWAVCVAARGSEAVPFMKETAQHV